MKFKYIIFYEDFSFSGTNDYDLAIEAAKYSQVYDLETGELIYLDIHNKSLVLRSAIPEAKKLPGESNES